jgi:hypothetical protein
MNKKKSEDLKKKQYPLYLTAKQKQGLDTLYQVFQEEYDGDITYQAFLRNLLFKGAKYFKIKYGIEDQEDKQEGESKVDLSGFDIDKIVEGSI